jgi:hypothetical protein
VTVEGTAGNYQLPVGQSLQITFAASYSWRNPAPPAFSVNSTTCTPG